MAETLNYGDETLTVRAGSLGGTAMRYHELAVQYWLNSRFFVREGYPVPVVFTSPMDAFSHFRELWGRENNPFSYLLDLKDANGKPIYEPHPSPIRYPIISVYRKGWKYRQYQNFSLRRWRRINWPTVSDAGAAVPGKEQQGVGLGKCQLGNVTTSRMPMAWDFRFQIDHFCNRPDTQAFFVESLMEEFWRTGGATPQTWIKVRYPGHYGEQLIRLYLEGDIESLTPEEPEDGKQVEYRTSLLVVVEGYDIDLRYKVLPAFWTLIVGDGGTLDPRALESIFDERVNDNNVNLDSRPNVPPPCTDLSPAGNVTPPNYPEVGGNLRSQVQFGWPTILQLAPATVTAGPEEGSLRVGFHGGSLVGESTTVTVGDSAAHRVGFVYGGLEVYVNRDQGGMASGFQSGALVPVVADSGAPFEAGGASFSFVNGALLDTTVPVSSLDSLGLGLRFFSGNLVDTVIPAPIGPEALGQASGLNSGALSDVIVDLGTKSESTGMTVGFKDGALV